MTNVSYRKKILEAAQEISTLVNDVSTIDLAALTQYAGLKENIILSEFEDLNQIFYEAAVLRYKQHESKSQKIARLPGEYSLSTLLKHDLSMIFFYARDVKNWENKGEISSAITYIQNYIEHTMPKYYFDVLRFNPTLLPNKDINAQVYAHFLVHSMFFFTKSELYTLNPDSKDLTAITRKLISSLFSRSTAQIRVD